MKKRTYIFSMETMVYVEIDLEEFKGEREEYIYAVARDRALEKFQDIVRHLEFDVAQEEVIEE